MDTKLKCFLCGSAMEYKLRKVYEKDEIFLREPTLHCTNIDCDITVVFFLYAAGFTEEEIYELTINQWNNGRKTR